MRPTTATTRAPSIGAWVAASVTVPSRAPPFSSTKSRVISTWTMVGVESNTGARPSALTPNAYVEPRLRESSTYVPSVFVRA
jgi:hypothetical protein